MGNVRENSQIFKQNEGCLTGFFQHCIYIEKDAPPRAKHEDPLTTMTSLLEGEERQQRKKRLDRAEQMKIAKLLVSESGQVCFFTGQSGNRSIDPCIVSAVVHIIS